MENFDKVSCILSGINREVVARKRENGLQGLELDTYVKSNVLHVKFSQFAESNALEIPLPYSENGVRLLGGGTAKALCTFWLEKEQRELDYLDVVYDLLFGKDSIFIPEEARKKGTCMLRQVVTSFKFGNAGVFARRFQQALGSVIEHFPLHTTDMNSYVVNNRIVVLDPVFEAIRSPEDQLGYQVDKARKYFGRGWTALGLSDQTLAEKNYLLKLDLRSVTPFGIRFHNAQRNLYSTLGMKGGEAPRIVSASEQRLADKCIFRKGWNWFTAFVDVPDVFEDQILIDISHVDKYVEYTSRIQIFGDPLVSVGQKIKYDAVLGVSRSGREVRFDRRCEKAMILAIDREEVEVGGQIESCVFVNVHFRRFFKDAFKVTNRHGNKGVIHMADLGYAIDPRTGEPRKIDVIVGAKTTGKRKNYGQVMEAIVNNVLESDPTLLDAVIRQERKKTSKLLKGRVLSRRVESSDAPAVVTFEDDWYISRDDLKATLVKAGFNDQATWECDTPFGKFGTVCGTVFWGVIKTPEDDCWDEHKTQSKDSRGLRRSGLKFSHVEMRALQTRFGEQNPIIDEIMSYAQGTDLLHEKLAIVKCMRGEYPDGKPALNLWEMDAVDNSKGNIISPELIPGTILDENFMQDGCLAALPVRYYIGTDEKDDIVFEGLMRDPMPVEATKVHEVQFIYIPSGALRKGWMHGTGKIGMSSIGEKLNALVMFARKLAEEPTPQALNLYLVHMRAYFDSVVKSLGSKKGDISVLGMSVRYPSSARATATLSNNLPKNTIEIHREVARMLKVESGEVVLVERFPCLGFVSIRLQKVRVTDDPMCRYTFRASGNCLVSENLDFDGDTLNIASFHTPGAKWALLKEWENPNKTCYDEIVRLNERKGAPHTKAFKLDDFNIMPFADLTLEQHAKLVEKNTGVKAQTGPTVSMTYDAMRLCENSDLARDLKTKVEIEIFLERAAQSVFEQKHGGESLCVAVRDGLCSGDVESLVKEGFKRGASQKICNVIRKKAAAIGITDLKAHHKKVLERGGSNIVKRLVREQNRIYFASRSQLNGIQLLKALDSPAVDIPSRTLKCTLSGIANAENLTFDEIAKVA